MKFPKYLLNVNLRQNALFKRISGNSAIMLLGGFGGQGLSFLSLLLVARSLGPEKLGEFALIQAYVMTIGVVFSFQSWEGMVKFGTDSKLRLGSSLFGSVLKFGMVLDASAAAISTFVAIVGVVLLGCFDVIPESLVKTTMLYCMVIPFRAVGLPESVFRIYDKFLIVALLQFLVAFIRIATIGVACFFAEDTWIYLLFWGGAEMIVNTICYILAWKILAADGHGRFLNESISTATKHYPGIWRFFLTTNVSSSVRLGVKEFDVFLVGVLLGTGSTGLFKIAREIARIPAVLVGPVQQVVYPELVRLWAERETAIFVKTVFAVNAICGIVGFGMVLVVTILAPWIVEFLAGQSYVGARWVLTIYLISVAIFTSGIALKPAILSQGRPQTELAVYLIAATIYFVTLPLMAIQWGLIGVGLAQIVFQAIWLFGMTLGIRQGFQDHCMSNVIARNPGNAD